MRIINFDFPTSYCYAAYPDAVAFLIGWTNIILCKPASLAVIVIAFAEYATAPFYPGCDPPAILQKFIVRNSQTLVFPKSISSCLYDIDYMI